MTQQAQTSAIDRLRKAIPTPSVQSAATIVIRRATAAIERLGQLDLRIFQHYESVEKLLEMEGADRQLRDIAKDVLTGVRSLDRYLSSRTPSNAESNEMDLDDFDFDFGEPTKLPTDVSLDEDDIDGAFALLAQDEQSCQERWQVLEPQLEALGYGLHSQLREFDERFVSALKAKRYLQALRELNDVGSSLTDGVFAIMTAIYSSYLGEIDVSALIPGHENTLSRALAIRRGLTNLRRVVLKHNGPLQNEETEGVVRALAFEQLRTVLNRFLQSPIFRIMRPADRVELNSFQNKLAGNSLEAARLDCDGLEKYLDSLAAVSQRDVLIKHDRDQIREIAELLEAARPLIDISPHGALAMLSDAFARADALYGLREGLDALIGEWNALPPEARTSPTDAVGMGIRLAPLIQTLS